MGRKSKYSEMFKSKALELIKIDGNSIRKVAKELGVPIATLDVWAKSEGVQSGFSSSEAADELFQMKKKVKRLEMENHILKKAAELA